MARLRKQGCFGECLVSQGAVNANAAPPCGPPYQIHLPLENQHKAKWRIALMKQHLLRRQRDPPNGCRGTLSLKFSEEIKMKFPPLASAAPLSMIVTSSTAWAQHIGHANYMAAPVGTEMPTERGDASFAAMAEIVQLLGQDPDTDWSCVDIDGLRTHRMRCSNPTFLLDL